MAICINVSECISIWMPAYRRHPRRAPLTLRMFNTSYGYKPTYKSASSYVFVFECICVNVSEYISASSHATPTRIVLVETILQYTVWDFFHRMEKTS